MRLNEKPILFPDRENCKAMCGKLIIREIFAMIKQTLNSFKIPLRSYIWRTYFLIVIITNQMKCHFTWVLSKPPPPDKHSTRQGRLMKTDASPSYYIRQWWIIRLFLCQLAFAVTLLRLLLYDREGLSLPKCNF